MSYMLPHLHNGWQVDQAILSEEDRVVVIRFGHDWDPTCMKMDEVLYSIAEKVTPSRVPPAGPRRAVWTPDFQARVLCSMQSSTETGFMYGQGLCQKWLEFLKT